MVGVAVGTGVAPGAVGVAVGLGVTKVQTGLEPLYMLMLSFT